MHRTALLAISAVSFAGLMITSVGMSRAQDPAAASVASASSAAAEVTALQGQVDALQQDADSLWNEIAELGGGNYPAESIRITQYRIHDIRNEIDRLEETLEKAAGSKQELQRLRDEMADTPIVTVEDVAKEAAKKAAVQGLKEVVSAAVGKAVGWVGLAGKVVTYGGRWVIRDLNVSSIEEMLRKEQITINDVNKLQSALWNERNLEARKLEKLKALRRQYEHKELELVEKKQALARSQERARVLDGPASRHAVTGRETDAEGDRQEAIRGAVTPSGPPPPRRRTGGVSVSTPKPVKSKPKKQSSKKTQSLQKPHSSQARQHETGTSAAVIQFGVGVGLQLLNRGSRSGSQQNQGNNWRR